MNLPSCSLTSTSTYITKRSRAWSCTHANDRHHLKLLKLCVCRVNLLLQQLQHPKLCNTFQWWCGCDVTKGQTIKSKKRKGKKKNPHYHHEVKALLCYPQSHVSLNELALSYQSPAVDNVKERNRVCLGPGSGGFENCKCNCFQLNRIIYSRKNKLYSFSYGNKCLSSQAVSHLWVLPQQISVHLKHHSRLEL